MRKSYLKAIWLATLLLLIATPSFAESLFHARDEASIATADGTEILAGKALVTGSCFAKVISVTSATGGEYVLIYDNTSATTATFKLDVAVATAGDTKVVPLYDAEFGTGVYAIANSGAAAGIHVTFIYSQ